MQAAGCSLVGRLLAAAALFACAALPLAGSVTAQGQNKSERGGAATPVPLPWPKASEPQGPAPKPGKTKLVEFEMSPFPYEGINPATGRPFINVDETGRRGRMTGSGRVYWEDETYSDQRVLLHIPDGFDVKKPGLIVVFFHGHGAAVDRDVRDRQRVAEQIAASRANAVLVAPQMAVKAADSSAGIFWEQGMFAQFLNEAAEQLALLYAVPGSTRLFDRMPVVIVSYSGGYLATAWCVYHGGANDRVRGVILLDSLYGEMEKFERWIMGNRNAFFVSAYLGSTRARNLEMQRILSDRHLPVGTSLDGNLRPGSIFILSGGSGDNHTDFANRAWGKNPVTDLLNRLPEYRRY
jgi:hypothetical protein